MANKNNIIKKKNVLAKGTSPVIPEETIETGRWTLTRWKVDPKTWTRREVFRQKQAPTFSQEDVQRKATETDILRTERNLAESWRSEFEETQQAKKEQKRLELITPTPDAPKRETTDIKESEFWVLPRVKASEPIANANKIQEAFDISWIDESDLEWIDGQTVLDLKKQLDEWKINIKSFKDAIQSERLRRDTQRQIEKWKTWLTRAEEDVNLRTFQAFRKLDEFNQDIDAQTKSFEENFLLTTWTSSSRSTRARGSANRVKSKFERAKERARTATQEWSEASQLALKRATENLEFAQESLKNNFNDQVSQNTQRFLAKIQWMNTTWELNTFDWIFWAKSATEQFLDSQLENAENYYWRLDNFLTAYDNELDNIRAERKIIKAEETAEKRIQRENFKFLVDAWALWWLSSADLDKLDINSWLPSWTSAKLRLLQDEIAEAKDEDRDFLIKKRDAELSKIEAQTEASRALARSRARWKVITPWRTIQQASADVSKLAKDILDNPDLLSNLTPTKRQQILLELSEAWEDVSVFTLNKLSAWQRDNIDIFDTLFREWNLTETIINEFDIWLWPIETRQQQFKQLFWWAEEFTQLESSLSNFSSLLLNLRSWAAVTPEEFKRISWFIPLITDDEKTFKTKAKRFNEEIQIARRNYVIRSTQTSKQILDSVERKTNQELSNVNSEIIVNQNNTIDNELAEINAELELNQ